MFGNDLNVQLFYLSKTVWFWCQCAAEHVIVKRAATFVRSWRACAVLIFLMYRYINKHLNESPFSFVQIRFFKILHFTVIFLFYQNNVSLFF